MITLFIFLPLLVLGVAIGFGVQAYNKLVRQRWACKNAWAQIDVQLQLRYDLIPNLVTTAKQYLSHERQTLEAVIAARAGAVQAHKALQGDFGASTLASMGAAEAGLGQALGRLMAVVEAYPELKANTLMKDLMDQLTHVEQRLGFARQGYNDQVQGYNTTIQTVPYSLLADKYGFEAFPFWEAEAGAGTAPKVQF